MNKVFKVIWNNTLQCWVAVSELSKAKGKTKSKSIKKLTALTAVSLLSAGQAVAVTGQITTNSVTSPIGAYQQGQGLAIGGNSGGSVTTSTGNSNTVAIGMATTANGKSAFAAAGGYAKGENATALNWSAAQGSHAIAIATNTTDAKLPTGPSATGEGGAKGDSAIAMGEKATAIGNSTIALSKSAAATAVNAIAIGQEANATRNNAVAIAKKAEASGNNAVAIATESKASGISAIAIGESTTAIKDRAIALGKTANAGGTDSVAVGADTKATGTSTIAVGKTANATAVNAIAIGESTTAIKDRAIALGKTANAGGTDSVAVGTSTQATGTNTIAVGKTANATGNNALAMGTQSKATEESTIAIGNEATAIKSGAIVIGKQAKTLDNVSTVGVTHKNIDDLKTKNFDKASNDTTTITTQSGNNGIAIGNGAQTGAGDATAIGTGSKALVGNSLALGSSATAAADSATALGRSSVALGGSSLALGQNAQALDKLSVAVGANAAATGSTSLAMMNNARANGQKSIAIGESTLANGQQSIAIGVSTLANGSHNVIIGTKAATEIPSTKTDSTGALTKDYDSYVIVDRWKNKAYDKSKDPADSAAISTTLQTAVLGAKKAFDSTPQNVVAIGAEAKVGNTKATAIGAGSKAYATNSTAIGHNSQAFGDSSNAIGYGATTYGDKSTALGNGSITYGKDSFAAAGGQALDTNSVAIGYGAFAGTPKAVAIGYGAQVSTENSIAIGENAKAVAGTRAGKDNGRNIVIGINANLDPSYLDEKVPEQRGAIVEAVVVGSGNTDREATKAKGTQSVAIGSNTTAYNSAVAIGNDDAVLAGELTYDGGGFLRSYDANGKEIISQRYSLYGKKQGDIYKKITGLSTGGFVNNEAKDGGVSIGIKATANVLSTAVGLGATGSGFTATAFGAGAVAEKQGSVALGAGSSTEKKTGRAYINRIILGKEYTWKGGNAVDFGDIVSVGKPGYERQIVNVAPGDISTESTDAINGSQLFGVLNTLERLETEAQSNYAGDNLDIVQAKEFNSIVSRMHDKYTEIENITKDNVAKRNTFDTKNATYEEKRKIYDDALAAYNKETTHTADSEAKLAEKLNAAHAAEVEANKAQVEVDYGLELLTKARKDYNELRKEYDKLQATMGNTETQNGTVIEKKLRERLDIVGGASPDNLTDNNIGVNAKGGKLHVQLSKELTDMKDIALDSYIPNPFFREDQPVSETNPRYIKAANAPITKVNGNGITITPLSGGTEAKSATVPAVPGTPVANKVVSLTEKGLDNGNNRIVNVAPGYISKDSTDAINGSQFYSSKLDFSSDNLDATKAADYDAKLATLNTKLSERDNLVSNLNTAEEAVKTSKADYDAKVNDYYSTYTAFDKAKKEETAANTELKNRTKALNDADTALTKATEELNSKTTAYDTAKAASDADPTAEKLSATARAEFEKDVATKNKAKAEDVKTAAETAKTAAQTAKNNATAAKTAAETAFKAAKTARNTAKTDYEDKNKALGKAQTALTTKEGEITAAQTDLDTARAELEGTSTVVSKKFNERLEILGGADKDSLTDNNIGVNVENGKIYVKLAKTLKDMESGLSAISGTNTKQDGLLNLDEKKAGSTTELKVADGTVVTAGDLRKMGWVVSSDKTTGDLTNAYSDQVKNANEVKFVGTGGATVSGKTENGVRTITVDVKASDSSPFEYVKQDANGSAPTKVAKADDNKFYPVDNNGNPDKTQTAVPDNEVVIAPKDGPKTIDNLSSNLPETRNTAAGNNPVTVKQDAPDAADVAKMGNNAATVGDVLNSGWNLRGAKSAGGSVEDMDFVKAYDTVEFVSGDADTTEVTVTTADNQKSVVTIKAKAKNDGTVVADTANAGKVKAGDNPNSGVTATKVADAINSAYWTATSSKSEGDNSGTSEEQIKAGSKVTFDAGKNISITQAGSKFTFATTADLTADSITIPTTGSDNVVINNAGINAGNKPITNVADGDVSADSKEAVNGSQLHKLATNTIKLTGSTGETDAQALNKENGLSFKVAGSGLATTTATGDTVTVDVAKTDVQNAAKEAIKVTGTSPITVTKDTTTTAGVDEYKVSLDGTAAADVIPLTYKANGAGDKTVTLDKGLNFTNGDNTTASIDKDGVVKYDVKLGTITTGTDGKATPDTTNGNVATVSDVANAVNNAFWNVTSDTDGGEFATTGHTKADSPVKAGEKVTLKAGDNLVIKQAGKDFTYSLNKELKDLSKVEVKDGNGNSVTTTPTGTVTTDGKDTTTVGPNGITIQPATPTGGTAPAPISLTKDGLNNGGKQINNVVSGLDKYPANKADGSTDPRNGLVNLEKPTTGDPTVKDNTAATVGDLRNMGWVVSSDKTTENLTAPYSDQVKNANEVKFVGVGAAVVSGKTDDNGVRTITVDVKADGQVVASNITKTADGSPVVKTPDGKYYAASDIDPKTGKPSATATEIPASDVTITSNAGASVVTGNQVADAIKAAGFVVGKQATALTAADFENKDERVNPDDQVRFADGQNTSVKLATKDAVDAAGNKVTTTTVKVDVVGIPVQYTKADGTPVTKVGDKFYPVDANGNPVLTKTDGSDNALTEDEKDDLIANVINPKADPNKVGDATTLGNIKSNLTPAYNQGDSKPTAADPSATAAAGDVTKSVTAPAAADVAKMSNNAATVGDVLSAGWNLQGNGTAKDFVKTYDTVNFVDGENTKVTVETDANGKVSTVKVKADLEKVTDNNPFEYAVKDPVAGTTTKVAKANDGKYYNPADVNPDGSVKETTPGTAATPVFDPANANGKELFVQNKDNAKPITNVVSGLDNFTGKTGTEAPLNDLRDLNKKDANNQLVVSDNTAATVGDLRNMGWVVSSDKATDNLDNPYSASVKNANEVKFVGVGIATVSGQTVGEVRTITVDTTKLQDKENTPFEYAKADGTTVVKANDGKFHDPRAVNPDGSVKPMTEVNGKTYLTEDIDQTTGQPKANATALNEPKTGDEVVINAKGTDPQTITNVKSNLPETKSQDANNPANITKEQALTKVNPNNAATVGDVLNAGWNLKTNGTALDFVRPFDSIDFINGANTTVEATSDGMTSKLQINVTGLPVTYTKADGTPVSKVGDKFVEVDPATGKPVIDTTTNKPKEVAPADLVTNLVNPNPATGKTGTTDPVTLGNVAQGAQVFSDKVDADGKPLVKVTDNGVDKYYTADQLENGKPKAGATEATGVVTDTNANKPYEGLADLNGSNANNVATVGDLKNLGWVVAADGNKYADDVRHTNKVEFKGEGLAKVTGETKDGIRTITVSVKEGDVVKSNEFVAKVGGKDENVVKIGNDYYKVADIDKTTGQPKIDKTTGLPVGPVTVDKDTTPVNNGAGFVTGNKVADALQQSGWTVGLAAKDKADKAFADATANTAGATDKPRLLSDAVVEKVNPNDEVRFADGKNTNVKAVTVESTDEAGNKVTTTTVKVDVVGMPVQYTDENGNPVAKVGDKFYRVDANGIPTGTALTDAEVDKLVSRVVDPKAAPNAKGKAVSLDNIKGNLDQAFNLDDAKVDSTTGKLTNPADKAVAADISKVMTAPDAAKVAKIYNNAATVGDVLNAGWNLQGNGTDKDFVKTYDTVNFVNGSNANVEVKASDDGKVNTIQVNVVGMPVQYTKADGTKVAKVGDKYYPVDKDGKPVLTKDDGSGNKVSNEVPANSLVTNLVNPVAPTTSGDENKMGDAVTLGNVAPGEVSGTSKEAINGSQLNKEKENTPFEYAKADGTTVVKANDGKFYAPTDVNPDGSTKATAKEIAGTDVFIKAKEEKPITNVVSGLGKYDVTTAVADDKDKAAAGLVNLNPDAQDANGNKVKDNTAATVGDLRNMGWVVAADGNSYTDQVKNANKVEFKGEGLAKVTGETLADGTRAITVSVKEGDVVKSNEFVIKNKDGSGTPVTVVKVTAADGTEKYYNKDDIDPTTGKPTASATPVTPTADQDVVNNGAGFVTGNKVADALQQSGWTVGLANKATADKAFADAEANKAGAADKPRLLSDTVVEKVNPNDQVRFADGVNTEVKAVTVESTDEAGNKVTTTTVKADVKGDLKQITSISSGSKDGEGTTISLGKGPKVNADGKYVDGTGNVVTNAKDAAEQPVINVNNARITGVADGEISPTSKDTVNGAQIYALAGGSTNPTDYTTVDKDGNPVTYKITQVTGKDKDNDGKDVTYTLKTYNVKGQTEYITNSVIEAVSKMNEQGIKFFHTNDGVQNPVAQSKNSVDSSASGPWATAIGSKAEAKGENSIAFGLGATAAGKNSISIGTGNNVSGNNSGAFGDPSIINADNSYSVGNNNTIDKGSENTFVLGNNVSQTAKNSVVLGESAGVTQEGGVALGAQSKATRKEINQNTVSVSSGFTAADDSKQQVYLMPGADKKDVAEVKATVKGEKQGSVSVGESDDKGEVVLSRQITNVAAGSRDSDAVNVSQLRANTNGLIKQIDGLGNRMNKMDKDLRAGIAGANAAAGLPQVYIPGKSMVAATVGTYRGQNAIAVGYSRASDNGKLILKIQGNGNTRGDFGGSVGMGYQW